MLLRSADVPAASAPPSISPNTPPQEIAFLAKYGVAPERLASAALLAQKEGVSADRALLAHGFVEEGFFYKCLAHHIGAAFVESCPSLLDVGKLYPDVIQAGITRFEGLDSFPWLAAPKGQDLLTVLRRARKPNDSTPRFFITTPSLLSRWTQQSVQRRIAAEASFALLSADRDFTALSGSTQFGRCLALLCIAAFILCATLPALSERHICAFAIGFVFLAAILFKLFVCVSATTAQSQPAKTLEDHELPTYTVLVALHKEARIVRRLIRRLDRLDYPRSKLEIKLIVEEDDTETRRALTALALSPHFEIIVAPPGEPRTKPRALNVALPLARGELLAVFDAEDAPEPRQLRLAAERFATASPQLACLQARLTIENTRATWLTRLYAIEYAALFELQNIGLAKHGLPFPVSGSSNHFRTAALRKIHGWDAWNVTEDADIGLRFARFGYRIDVLDSATQEEAPATIEAWLGQRQRWHKGWLQTLITLSRSPLRVMSELGLVHSACTALLFLGLLLGPLFWIPANLFLIGGLIQNGVGLGASLSGLCLTCLWASVCLLGLGSLFWYGFYGMKRQGLLDLWPSLFLLPLYYGLHTVAVWMAFYDLFRRPFYWQKTEHGLAYDSFRRRSALVFSRMTR